MHPMLAQVLSRRFEFIAVSMLLLLQSLIVVPTNASIIDFEGFANGTEITGGDLGGVVLDVTTTSLLDAAAIYDSDITGGEDPDLEVGLGNLLIVQSLSSPTKLGDIYTTPNDDNAGGTINFTFSLPLELLSIDLVDIDDNSSTTITLTDLGGLTRVYSVPDNWTGQLGDGNDGYGTLSLLTTTPQIDDGPSATVVTSPGYDPTMVSMLALSFDGSGGLDNVEYTDLPPSVEPAPEMNSLVVWSILGIGAMLYRQSKTANGS